MKISIESRTPLFDEVRIEGSVLEHYQERREDYGELLDTLHQSASMIRGQLGRRRLWHINSTAFGGGVAEMLPHHICLLRELGLDARWLIFKPTLEPFFQFTKGLHNALHDVSTEDFDELLPHYFEVSRQGAEELQELIGPDDVLIVHDPQPLIAAAQFLDAHPHPAIWRCHIGYPKRTPTVDKIWEFLGTYLPPFQRVVLSDREYALDTRHPVDFIQPSISPFSSKNRHYEDPMDHALESMVAFGGQEAPRSLRDILGSRYFLHVSRWDGLKGIDRIMAAFECFAGTAMEETQDVRLVIAGPDPAGVADDPEEWEYFRKYADLHSQLPADVRQRVHLACISMEDHDANAEIVGRLQQNALGIFQLSREEGFGLTATEALFRGKPVIVSSAFGLRKQVTHGKNGVVLDDPGIETKAAYMMNHLATRPGDFGKMAANAREICLRSSTQIAQIPNWFQTIQLALASFEMTHPEPLAVTDF